MYTALKLLNIRVYLQHLEIRVLINLYKKILFSLCIKVCVILGNYSEYCFLTQVSSNKIATMF